LIEQPSYPIKTNNLGRLQAEALPRFIALKNISPVSVNAFALGRKPGHTQLILAGCHENAIFIILTGLGNTLTEMATDLDRFQAIWTTNPG
jgi:hypothetical protein